MIRNPFFFALCSNKNERKSDALKEKKEKNIMFRAKNFSHYLKKLMQSAIIYTLLNICSYFVQ